MPKIPLEYRGFISPPTTEQSPFLVKDDVLVICDGINPFWKAGNLIKDTGYASAYALAAGQPIFTLSAVKSLFGTQEAIAVTNDPTGLILRLWADVGIGFTQIVSSEWDAFPDHYVESCSFFDYVIMVGWNRASSYLPAASLHGTDFSITDQVTDAPRARYAIPYRDRVYLLGVKYQIPALPWEGSYNVSYDAWVTATSYEIGDVVSVTGSETFDDPVTGTGNLYTAVNGGSVYIKNTGANFGSVDVGARITGSNPANPDVSFDVIVVSKPDSTTIEVDTVLDLPYGVANWAYSNPAAGANPYYRCILDHTSGAASEPGVGGSWQTYWETRDNTLITVEYDVGDYVTDGGKWYKCTVSHVSTNDTKPPNVAYWVEVDEWLEAPYRTIFSDIPVQGIVSWDLSNFLDIDFSEEITGGAEAFDRLIIFTNADAWIYDQISFKKYSMWPGCANHRSIQTTDSYLIYANEGGVFASTGGRPANVSMDILELINNSDITKWQSAYIRVNNEYHLYIGDTSANGETYNKCLLTLDLDSLAGDAPKWRWRQLSDEVYSMAELDATDGFRLHMGAIEDIFRKNSPTDSEVVWSDDGDPFSVRFRTGFLDGGDPTIIKRISGLMAYTDKSGKLELWWRKVDTQKAKPSQWERIGKAKASITEMQKSIQGHYIQIEGRDFGDTEGFSFSGMTLLAAPDGKKT